MSKPLDDEVIESYLQVQKFHFLAEQCLNLVKKSISDLLRPHRINHSQYIILLMLSYANSSGNDVIATELSYILGLERHSISALIDKLHRKGLIERFRSTSDRRVIHLKITEKGLRIARSIQHESLRRIAVIDSSSSFDFQHVYEFLFTLREAITDKNEMNAAPYQKAYEKLVLQGQRVLENGSSD